MSVTLVGALMMAYAAGLMVLSRRRRLLQAIVFFASFSSTAVINFGAYGMAPVVVFLLPLLLSKAASGEAWRATRIGRDHLALGGLLLGFALVCVTTLLVNGAMRGMLPIQVTQTAYVLFGVLLTLVLSLDFARGDRLEDAIRALRAGAVFIAAWGLVQAGCFYAGIAYPAFLFNNSTSHFADMFDQRAGAGLIRIASVATEPSFMASSLMIFGAFGATLIVVEPAFRSRGWLLAVGLVLFVVAASTSSTGYVGLAMLMLLLGLRRPGLTVAAGLGAALASAAALSLMPRFAAALYAMTLGKGASDSFTERSQATWHAIGLFVQQPWLGWGWGSSFSYSIVSTLLADVGLIGTGVFTAAFIGALLSSRAARRSSREPAQWRLRAYAVGIENAMIVTMVQAMVSGFRFVVADFWVLWALAIAIPSGLACAAAKASAVSPVRAWLRPSGRPVATPAPR